MVAVVGPVQRICLSHGLPSALAVADVDEAGGDQSVLHAAYGDCSQRIGQRIFPASAAIAVRGADKARCEEPEWDRAALLGEGQNRGD